MIETSGLTSGMQLVNDAEGAARVSETQLVSKYSDSVYRFCLSLVFRREDADDLFQDTYLKAFTKIDKIAESDNPQGFLMSIAASLWKSRKRKYARRNRIAPEVVLDDVQDVGEDGMEDRFLADEERFAVRKLVDALPDKLKIPVVMYYTAEMSVSDIAKALKLPLGTVKSHLHRAREIIRKGLISEYGYE